MKTLMVSHLFQLLGAEAGTPGSSVPGVRGRAPGAPNPAPRGRLLQRDNFPPAPRPLTIPGFCLSRYPRARINSACVGSWTSAGSLMGQQRAGVVGALLRGWGIPQSNRLAKTKRGDGRPLQTFWVSLNDCKLARIAGVKPHGSSKERVPRLEIPAGELARGSLPRSARDARPCPLGRRALPPAARRRAPPALCRESWEAAAAESSLAPEQPLRYPRPRAASDPAGLRAAAPGPWPAPAGHLPRPGLAGVFSGCAPPGWALSGSLLSPPARSAMVWQCV